MEKEVRKTWFFKQTPQQVWECLTQPELLEQWLGKTDLQPVVGHKFRFQSPNGNDAHCEVLEVEPFNRLSYTWQKSSLKDNRSYQSKVAWTLVRKMNGTELQLVHGDFITLEDLAGHDKGWNDCLKQMEELINTLPR